MTKVENISATVDKRISRRTVLKGLAGGLVLTAPMVSTPAFADLLIDTTDQKNAFKPSVYFSIHGDGRIKIFIHRVEMGQGSRTGLAQVIADELSVDWDSVSFLQAEGHEKYGSQNTDGSTSIRNFYWPLRKAAASARMMLEAAGAKEMGVPVASVKAEKGFVVAGNKRIAFTDLVNQAKAEQPPADADIRLKERSEFTHIRKPQKILDMKDITHGKAIYAQDIRVPGMVYSVIARPPVPGGTVKSYDDSEALKVKGVMKVIKLRDQAFPGVFLPLGGLAVIASNTFAAIKGRAALKIDWNHGANAAYSSDSYEKQLWDSVAAGGTAVRKVGDADTALTSASKVISGNYYVPHQSHAHLEAPAAVAWWEDGKCTLHSSSQDPQRAREVVAGYCGVAKENITSYAPLLGAAFGRKSKPDFACEAAWLAREVGKPLKVVWTREDDMQHGYYHTVSAQSLEVGLDDSGTVTAWRHRAAYPSIFGTFNPAADRPGSFEIGQCAADLPYDIPNMSVEACQAKSMIRVGWMRSVNCIHQGFATGSMIGEIAAATGKSQLQTWLDVIGPDRIVKLKEEGFKEDSNYGNSEADHPLDTSRLKAVIKKAAAMAGYKDDKATYGKAIGLAGFRSFNAYVAVAIEVDTNDGVKIPRAWVAVDCGVAVNPDRIKTQMEGAVVFSMAYFFHSGITVKDGAVVEANFDTNPLPRIDEAPEVQVYIVDSEANPAGVGEPGVSPVAAAIGNAIFVASGKRVRRLPYVA